MCKVRNATLIGLFFKIGNEFWFIIGGGTNGFDYVNLSKTVERTESSLKSNNIDYKPSHKVYYK